MGVDAPLGRIIRKACKAASRPTSNKRHDDNQAGNDPRQTDSTESHSHPRRLKLLVGARRADAGLEPFLYCAERLEVDSRLVQ